MTSGDAKWRTAGVGSTDVAAIFGCAADDQNVLTKWAEVVSKQEISALKKLRMKQGDAAWLDWRKLGLGGSEVACVVGANPYRDSKADRIWARKLPSDHPQAKGEIADNSNMAFGRLNEPDARRIYEGLFGWSATDVCVLSDDYDCVRCSLDGLRDDDKVVLEIKCPGERNHQKYLSIAAIEDHFDRQTAYAKAFPYYRYQMLYQLMITGADFAHFVSYRPDWPDENDRFVVFPFYPEPDEQRRLLERVLEFWSYVERREPPPKSWLEPNWRLPVELNIPETSLDTPATVA